MEFDHVRSSFGIVGVSHRGVPVGVHAVSGHMRAADTEAGRISEADGGEWGGIGSWCDI